MGQAKLRKKNGTFTPKLPDIPVSDAQGAAARALLELLNKEVEAAQQRINSRRLALNRWAGDTMAELKLPEGKYTFDAGKMAFVDRRSTKGAPTL